MPYYIKQREIMFNPLHEDANQAATAKQMLIDFEGIVFTDSLSTTHLLIHYDLRFFTLNDIEDLLQTVGFHLDNSLFIKLKRALYHYTEETERANLGCSNEQSRSTRETYINRYQQLPHGCRDQRPKHWRNYL